MRRLRLEKVSDMRINGRQLALILNHIDPNSPVFVIKEFGRAGFEFRDWYVYEDGKIWFETTRDQVTMEPDDVIEISLFVLCNHVVEIEDGLKLPTIEDIMGCQPMTGGGGFALPVRHAYSDDLVDNIQEGE